MTESELKDLLARTPDKIIFNEVMSLIDELYDFTPSAFTNGRIHNNAGENNGSCKLFAFAQLNNFSKEDTLYCFGEHYQSVINDPGGDSHQNIRNFMEFSWQGISFDTFPLHKK